MLVAIYVLAGRVPDMSSPLRVTDASFIADGGSAWIEITDSEGKKMAMGVRGSLDRERSDFPVYLQRWHPTIPLPMPVEPRSDAGRSLLEVVERAGRDGGIDAAQMLAPVRAALSKAER